VRPWLNPPFSISRSATVVYMQWLPVVYTCMLSTSTAVFTSGWTPVVITVAVSLAVPCVQVLYGMGTAMGTHI